MAVFFSQSPGERIGGVFSLFYCEGSGKLETLCRFFREWESWVNPIHLPWLSWLMLFIATQIAIRPTSETIMPGPLSFDGVTKTRGRCKKNLTPSWKGRAVIWKITTRKKMTLILLKLYFLDLMLVFWSVTMPVWALSYSRRSLWFWRLCRDGWVELCQVLSCVPCTCHSTMIHASLLGPGWGDSNLLMRWWCYAYYWQTCPWHLSI